MKLRSGVGIVFSLIVLLMVWGCAPGIAGPAQDDLTDEQSSQKTAIIVGGKPANGDLANIISVEVSGEEGAYQFSVGISSRDEGCDQYADWWEVFNLGGELIYRRILLHSHVDEQPFVRGGGPVNISSDAVVWVRAHMHPAGYGGLAMKGSVAQGFEQIELNADFVSDLAESLPLPAGCDF